MARRKGSGAAMTPLELKVMQALWRLGPSSVQTVQRHLPGDLAYTTVQTMLNLLHRKEHVTRRLRGRAYEYSARESEETTMSTVVSDLLHRVFGGSPEDLVMSLVKARHLDAERLARLAARVESARNAETAASAEPVGKGESHE